MSIFDSFVRKHDYLICVDSDGCVMDTMNCKHFQCFGPRMVDEWNLNAWREPILQRWNEINLFSMTRGINRFKGLALALTEIDKTYTPIPGVQDAWREPILQRWNEINLFSMTRGINRFKGLALALTEIDKTYTPIPGVQALAHWAETAPALSNAAVEQAAKDAADPDAKLALTKALNWSKAVNASIVDLPEELKIPYPGAKEGLAAAHQFADVAMVSSANRDAVEEEWGKFGLLDHTDIVLAQDVGSKAGLAAAHQFADVAMVSSANRDAVEEEWGKFGLLDHTDIVLAQDVGSKAACIAAMLRFGYDTAKVLMIGDAPGDADAAMTRPRC